MLRGDYRTSRRIGEDQRATLWTLLEIAITTLLLEEPHEITPWCLPIANTVLMGPHRLLEFNPMKKTGALLGDDLRERHLLMHAIADLFVELGVRRNKDHFEQVVVLMTTKSRVLGNDAVDLPSRLTWAFDLHPQRATGEFHDLAWMVNGGMELEPIREEFRYLLRTLDPVDAHGYGRVGREQESHMVDFIHGSYPSL